MGKSAPAFLMDWRSPWALSFASYAAMRTRLSTEPLDPHVRAVVYDAEGRPLTPLAEQRDPAHYTALAVALVRRRHLLLDATPATDLVTVAWPRATKKYPAFLRLGIAQQIARYADLYEIQARGSEANRDLYRHFVAAATAQAREGNPAVDVLLGVSTNLTGHFVSAETRYQDVPATRRLVSGYWLNIPGASVYCPTCGSGTPHVGSELLALLSGS